jgi:hypothetical protein
LAKSLLERETIDITDIIDLIGDRPFKIPDSLKDYLREISERKAAKQLKEEEKLKQKEEELALASMKTEVVDEVVEEKMKVNI